MGGKWRQQGQQGFSLILLESLPGRKPSVWLNTMNAFSNQTNMELSLNRILKGKKYKHQGKIQGFFKCWVCAAVFIEKCLLTVDSL